MALVVAVDAQLAPSDVLANPVVDGLLGRARAGHQLGDGPVGVVGRRGLGEALSLGAGLRPLVGEQLLELCAVGVAEAVQGAVGGSGPCRPLCLLYTSDAADE